ncbi:MAG TPA: glycosyltransferase family 2 protein [Syntrophomonadaceae bacterium]|nr:glycosyltransferase family 2 protein [Syntrophomonadaceae bacterium]
MTMISVVVPCYNEQDVLEMFYAEAARLAETMPEVGFEFVFVDDGSRDRTLELLKGLQHRDKRVRYYSFSRNFGKESAIYAGMEKSSGDYVAIIDADLQDPPGLIKDMYAAIIHDGYDCVATRRTDRAGEPPIRSFFARRFYRIINRISDVKLVDGERDFRLMTRQMVDSILQVCECNRFSKGIFAWVGFKTKWIEYDNRERAAGSTKWSFWKLYLYSLDGIIAFSTTPLAISSIIGAVFFLLALIMGTGLVIQQLAGGGSSNTWTALVAILLFITGIQLFCMGIVGQYLSRTYLETKRRPKYILREYSEN